MLRTCVSLAYPSRFVPADHRDRLLVPLGGHTVLLFRCPSNDFLGRVARRFVEVGEWKSRNHSVVGTSAYQRCAERYAIVSTCQAYFLEKEKSLKSRVNQPGRNPPRLRPVTLGTFASFLISASSKTRALAAMCSLQSIPSSAMRRSRPMLMPRIVAASRVLMSFRLVWIAITMP